MSLRASISLSVLQASVSVERITAATNYNKAEATGIWVDPDSNNRMVKDEYTLAEVRFTLLEKNLTDSVTLPDVTGLHPTLPKTDTIASIVDTFAKAVAYNRSFTDAFTLDDASSIDKDYYGNKGNIFGFTDLLGLTYNKALTDSYTVGDVIRVSMLFARTVTETLPLSETAELGVTKPFTDIATVSEVNATSVGKNVTDLVTFSDTSTLVSQLGKLETLTVIDTPVRSLSKAVADAFALDDTALVDKDYFGNKGNVVGVSDVFTAVFAYNRAYADNVTFSEVTGKAVSKDFYDTINIFDNSVLHGGLNSTALNSQALNSKTNQYTGASAINVNTGVADTEALALTEITLLGISKGLTDSAGIVDISTLHIRTNKGELLSVGDTTNTDLSKTKAESLSLSDIPRKGYAKTLSNTYNINDILTTNLSKNITDAFTLDDSALVDKDFYGSKGNIVGVSDVVSVTKVGRRLLNGATFNRTQIN